MTTSKRRFRAQLPLSGSGSTGGRTPPPDERTSPPGGAAYEVFDQDAAAPPAASEPSERLGHLERRRQWRQEERARRYAARRSVRFPIFTRSILLWMMLFALVGVAFGASGAFWWAHFNTQVAEIREETTDIEARSNEAMARIESERNASLAEIEAASAPLEDFLAEARTVQLAGVFAEPVWFVATQDENGVARVGSAFTVVTTPSESLFVTSFAVVQASALQPGPEILLRNGNEEVRAELVNTDPGRDLALLRIPRGNLAVLEWATEDQQSKALGARVFAVSGFGGLGASLTPGLISDQSTVGFLHTAPIGTIHEGGPMVLADGRIIGVASRSYQALGFDPGEVRFSVPINTICEALLDCGGGRQRPGNGDPIPEEEMGPVGPD